MANAFKKCSLKQIGKLILVNFYLTLPSLNVSEVTVIGIISNMESKTSMDANGICMKMLTFIRYEIAKPFKPHLEYWSLPCLSENK